MKQIATAALPVFEVAPDAVITIEEPSTVIDLVVVTKTAVNNDAD